MLRPFSLIRRTTRAGWRLAALVAVLAQGWIAAAPLSEGRGAGLASHVEAAGNHRGHFTHDEASCAACAVLSLHVLAAHPVTVPAAFADIVSSREVSPIARIAAATPHTFRSRAPPSDA
ncbi:MAG: hypothetical protein M3Z30_10835 [Gemmatimonadota bacterium]|nr:hypothetical protein [Gemmatimonadota bacterium]